MLARRAPVERAKSKFLSISNLFSFLTIADNQRISIPNLRIADGTMATDVDITAGVAASMAGLTTGTGISIMKRRRMIPPSGSILFLPDSAPSAFGKPELQRQYRKSTLAAWTFFGRSPVVVLLRRSNAAGETTKTRPLPVPTTLSPFAVSITLVGILNFGFTTPSVTRENPASFTFATRV
jgi:hypothetical protein